MMRFVDLAVPLLAIIASPVLANTPPTLPNAPSVLPKAIDIKVDFNRSSITSAVVSGDTGDYGRAATIDDPARMASISKLVTALAAMRLVDQGKLDLDRDISLYLGWQIRNPAFPDTPITMRQLLSHRSGLRDTIDYILPLDGDLQTVLSNPKAWEPKHKPGDYFSYANINSPLIAVVLESVTKERFDVLVARLVLTPLKLDACFNWSAGCSAGRRGQAVTLLRPTGKLAKDEPMRGIDPCPVAKASDDTCDIAKSYKLGRNGSAFSPQGGLRISPRDLTRIGQVMLAQGKPLMSKKSFATMIGPVWTFDGKNGDDEKGYFKAYGLGVHWMDDTNGKMGGGKWIGHVGEAYSLRAGFWVNMKARKGFVRYVTMVDEFAPVGHCFDTCP
jgi:CubicO group peptidase (beta-lactamase class C family)